MNLIFDTHAHYDDEAFDPDRDAVLSALPAGARVVESGAGFLADGDAVKVAAQ